MMAKLRRGDTLIEVVFALAILATILTVMTSGAVNAWRTSRVAGERTQASAIANEQAEALRAYKKVVDAADWQSFKENFTDASGGQKTVHMAPVQQDANSQQTWEVKSGEGGAGGLSLILPSALVAITQTGPAAADAKSIELKITVTWRSLGSTTLNSTTQLMTITEDD